MTNWCRKWVGNTCALAINWRSKMSLEGPDEIGGFIIKGLPCWSYTSAGVHPWESMPDSIFSKFDSKNCWYGICLHHSIAMTHLFQAPSENGWTTVSGYQFRAMRVSRGGHAYCETYIKGLGYFRIDVSRSDYLAYDDPYTLTTGKMCNMHQLLPDGGYGNMGYVAYNPEWAGFPRGGPTLPPSTESYINCTTSPTGARIWLKKY